MIINRHNYEEFFLLYVDSELKPEERTEVENFVIQHPDLKKELEILQEIKLTDSNTSFENKEVLYKQEEGISLTNYQEHFLLSVDHELNEKQVDDVEKFVLKHPELQDEYTLLKKVKLEPEPIEYKEKAGLYKTERRIVPMVWMRMGAAAAVIAVIAFTWIFNQNSLGDTRNNDFAKSALPSKELSKKNNSALLEKAVTEQPVASLQDKTNNATAGEDATASTDVLVKRKTERSREIDSKQETVALPKAGNNLQKQQIEPTDIASVELPKEPAISAGIGSDGTTAIASNPLDKESINAASYTTKQSINESPLLAKQAVYQEIETDEEDNSLYIGSAEINKNKLKGLLKKAASLFDKNADTDDDKTLRIAGFRIRTK